MTRGQGQGPLGRPFKEELVMRKSDEIVDQMFDEGFEVYNNTKKVERYIDYLLDMCGAPHHKKRLEENTGELNTGSMGMIGRPYDHPKQVKIRAIINIGSDNPVDDIDIEGDVNECDAIQGEEYPGEFEGASPNNLPEEEPAKEMTPQKKQNRINTVPNQYAPALLAAIKGEMMAEYGVATIASGKVMRNAKKFMMKYNIMARKTGKQGISLKQANRMLPSRFK